MEEGILATKGTSGVQLATASSKAQKGYRATASSKAQKVSSV